MAASQVYVFGPFHYDPEQRLLFRQGEVVALVPKAIDTLHVLLERRGRVVEKADLMKLVWPDTTVEEVGLARNISLLRKALDDESGQYIETIPRRGYRFAAEAPMQGPGRWPRKWARIWPSTGGSRGPIVEKRSRRVPAGIPKGNRNSFRTALGRCCC